VAFDWELRGALAHTSLPSQIVIARLVGWHRARLLASQGGFQLTNDNDLSALIGDIYDASLDPSLWPQVLKGCAGFVDGWSARLFSKEPASKSAIHYFQDGTMDPGYVELYFDKYVKFDPLSTRQYFAELEVPVTVGDLMPYDEFLDTRFYREWVRPQGIVDCIHSLLDKSVTSIAMFGVFRHERDGVADVEARHRMRLIVPHIRRAALIANVIDLRAAQAETLAEALDGLSTGMFLVDASGHIMHANAAGHVLLEAGDVIQTMGGHLLARDRHADRVLREVFAAAGEGDAAIGSNGISITINQEGGDPFVAHLLPLTSGERSRAGTSYKAAAALFVHKAALATASPPEVIAKTYRLTPTELRVMLAVVDFGSILEIAEALGIAETTVKFHLRNLYAKTGTNRQADLVKLLAAFSNPLLDRPAELLDA
jgi:DNA-binding CsgD family transcriptional regulator/PAS domain-containing protein